MYSSAFKISVIFTNIFFKMKMVRKLYRGFKSNGQIAISINFFIFLLYFKVGNMYLVISREHWSLNHLYHT